MLINFRYTLLRKVRHCMGMNSLSTMSTVWSNCHMKQ